MKIVVFFKFNSGKLPLSWPVLPLSLDNRLTEGMHSLLDTVSGSRLNDSLMHAIMNKKPH